MVMLTSPGGAPSTKEDTMALADDMECNGQIQLFKTSPRLLS